MEVLVVKSWLRLVFLLALLSLAYSAPAYRPGQLMLLVIGRSASAPDFDQQALLERVQALRTAPGLNQLKVATMHFDRPREAAFARQVLGVTARQLPAVCLVELDAPELRPIRTLYCWPSVTGARLAEVDKMADIWAQMANAPLPMLTPQPPPALVGGPPVPTQGSTPLASAPESFNRPDAASAERLAAGVNLPVNSWVRSQNGRYGLLFQQSGNLVVYRLDRSPYMPLWNSATYNSGAVNLRLGNDGVLRLFDSASRVIWQAGESGAFSHCYMLMQDDGNLVIYRENGNGVSVDWASNSNETNR
ncbi:hypothetical protein JST97_09935 [bacterium]|nr:hypothetical protein [bacterium]